MKRHGLLWLVGGLLVLGGLAGCANRDKDKDDNDRPYGDTTDSNEASASIGAGGGGKSPGYASLGAIAGLLGVALFLRRRAED